MLLPGQTRFGPRRTAIQRRLRRFHNRRIVRALAFYQGWWGVRPKSRVTSQPPRLVDLLYREDPHILCFREACQQPSLPSLFGMPHGHSLSCLLIRRYRMSAVTFCLLLCVPRYQLAQTPVSPHGAAGQHKQTPRPPAPSSGCRIATHFMTAHKAVPHGCRHFSLLLCVHDTD